MPQSSNESRVILALEAIKNDKNLSVRAAAKIYDVPATTIRDRRDGRTARRDTRPNSTNLTESEEQSIIQYVLELATRSFPLRLRGVEKMANHLPRVRDAPPVGKLWAHRFVKRQPELCTRWSRKYDYQRAKCKDPKLISEWFALVQNIKAKYGILDDDSYNFDETGFIMGMIFAGIVVITSDGRMRAKLAQPGNRECSTNPRRQCVRLGYPAIYHSCSTIPSCQLVSRMRSPS